MMQRAGCFPRADSDPRQPRCCWNSNDFLAGPLAARDRRTSPPAENTRYDRDKEERAFWGQLFWPRPGGRDISAEVDYDRPCPDCGYNLRGMPIRARCPECGSIGGWN